MFIFWWNFWSFNKKLSTKQKRFFTVLSEFGKTFWFISLKDQVDLPVVSKTESWRVQGLLAFLLLLGFTALLRFLSWENGDCNFLVLSTWRWMSWWRRSVNRVRKPRTSGCKWKAERRKIPWCCANFPTRRSFWLFVRLFVSRCAIWIVSFSPKYSIGSKTAQQILLVSFEWYYFNLLIDWLTVSLFVWLMDWLMWLFCANQHVLMPIVFHFRYGESFRVS